MSSHDSGDHVQSDPAQKPNEDEKLEARLQEQAMKLQALRAEEQRLNAKGMRLKFDYVANNRTQGRILTTVRDWLKEKPGEFKKWVKKNTDIGYSTALLRIDLDENYDEVKERFANSNPLELTVRQLRDANRDKRQAEGKGKPGSGRRKRAAVPKEHKASLACGLRDRWELNKAEPDFNPPQQSEEECKQARLCFEQAKNADSTFATVAQATGKDEVEVKRLLRGLDIDKLDALKPTEQGDQQPDAKRDNAMTEANGSNLIFSFRGTNIDEKTALDYLTNVAGCNLLRLTAPPQGEDAIREELGRLEALWEAMNYLTIAGIIPGEEDGVEDVGEQFAHLEQMVAGVTKDDYPAPKIVAMENCFVKEGCFVVECIPGESLPKKAEIFRAKVGKVVVDVKENVAVIILPTH
jgi:hypothetical protein